MSGDERPTRYIDYPTSRNVRAWYRNPTERVIVKRRMAMLMHEQDELYRMCVEACLEEG